jgi:serine acetyltransferase
MLGIGAKGFQEIKIVKCPTIGVETFVLNDIPSHSKVVANPGRII